MSAVPKIRDAVVNGTKDSSDTDYDYYKSEQGELYVDKTVTVTGVFTWNMMRWAIFPTSITEQDETGIKELNTGANDDADVYTILGVNLGKVDINALPAGMYIKGGIKYMKR